MTNILEIVLVIMLSVELGALITWIAFDHFFYQPMRKMAREALKGWKESNNSAIEMLLKKEHPHISPIQIKKKK